MQQGFHKQPCLPFSWEESPGGDPHPTWVDSSFLHQTAWAFCWWLVPGLVNLLQTGSGLEPLAQGRKAEVRVLPISSPSVLGLFISYYFLGVVVFIFSEKKS